MAQYTVRKGDCFESIARQFGFGDYKVIYNHPQNAELKQNRPDPNLLKIGDEIFIPEKELREESCATEQKHRFQLIEKKVKFRVVIKDDEGTAFADKKYELEIDGKPFEGETDASGFIEQEIPADARSGKLKVFTEDEKLKVLSWDLELGSLEPHITERGAKGRLKNLGFYFGEVDEEIDDDKTKEALKTFQTKQGIDPSGELNDETKNKLRDSHDKK